MLTLLSPLPLPPALEPPPHAASPTLPATRAADTAKNFLALINLVLFVE
jgi:hypothetical protein